MSLLEHFSALEDPRQSWKVVYPLPEVLLLVLCATLGGAEDFVEVVRWGRSKIAFLRRFLPYERGIPRHDTLCDVVSALDPELFRATFAGWVEGLRDVEPDIVAIDGKTSRRSHDRAKGRSPLHLVSAWASRQRLVLGQQATVEKSNEIEAIPLLLERLALTGALVTIDAMGATPRIARAVLDRGADYLLALKANQGHLFEEAELYFRDAADTDRLETVDADHGRIETRRHAVSRDVSWLRADRAGRAPLPGLAGHRPGRGRGGERRQNHAGAAILPVFSPAGRPDLRPRGARALGRGEPPALGARRGLSRRSRPLRSGYGPENMAVVKHMALNLLNRTAKTDSLKTRGKRTGWDDDYLQAVIAQTA